MTNGVILVCAGDYEACPITVEGYGSHDWALFFGKNGSLHCWMFSHYFRDAMELLVLDLYKCRIGK